MSRVASDAETAKKRKPAATRIVELLTSGGSEFFHTPGREPFCTVLMRDHWEVLGIADREFHDWLAELFFKSEGSPLTQHALVQAISVLKGRAIFYGSTQDVYVRLAEQEGAVYLDLANERRDVVKITSEGWEISRLPPVKFKRPRGMQALPCPVRGGSINQLRDLVNVRGDDQWVLLVAWLLGALSPAGPYPVLVIQGDHGSAKSTATKLIRQIIDPCQVPLRSEPRDNRDLMIAARNNWCLAFDNLSGIPPSLSDALCRLATGGGFSTRELYADTSEVLFQAKRPLILNGIDVGISRGDLLDRAIILQLPSIGDSLRRTEAVTLQRFKEAWPSVLGALLDAVACGLRRVPEVRLSSLPRMADFATWVSTAEPALGWSEGTFLRAYHRSRIDSSQVALEASPLVPLVEQLVAQGPWNGTAAELNTRLIEMTSSESLYRQTWPGKPRVLSGMLRRLAPDLGTVGIHIEFFKSAGTNSRRMISIRTEPGAAVSGEPTDSSVLVS